MAARSSDDRRRREPQEPPQARDGQGQQLQAERGRPRPIDVGVGRRTLLPEDAAGLRAAAEGVQELAEDQRLERKGGGLGPSPVAAQAVAVGREGARADEGRLAAPSRCSRRPEKSGAPAGRGAVSMRSGSGCSRERARPGKMSEMMLIHSSCITLSGNPRPSAMHTNITMISVMLVDRKKCTDLRMLP